MEITDIRRRLDDLSSRCERSGCITCSSFLTPLEVYENERFYPSAFFTGGYEDAERKAAIFIPEWMEKEDIDISEYIYCLKLQSFFGIPSHRDYMGAILGLGISRDRIGDIVTDGDTAYVFCLGGVEKTIETELKRAGRISVKASKIQLFEFTAPQKKIKKVSFTVKSLRLDAVTGDMFSLSRSNASDAIKEGLVTLNYSICEKCDAQVKEGDIISLKGKGKGKISEAGGRSRRDRIFVTADIYI